MDRGGSRRYSPAMASLTLDTLQKLRDGHYTIWAACEIDARCYHSAALDLDALIARFGPNFPFVDRRADLLASLVCSQCGRKGMQTRIAAPRSAAAGRGS